MALRGSVMLLAVLLLAVASSSRSTAFAFVVAGNGVQCSGGAGSCPCGAPPPAWPDGGAARWCPLGCARAADGAPDESGDLAVDLRGVCASAAFAAWRAPATSDALAVAGCPLSAMPRVSLRFFLPCINLTALLAGEANSSACTPCAVPPDAPSPPPPSPPAPPPAPPPGAPAGSVQVVETTLCLAGVGDDVDVDSVSAALAALLGLDASAVAVSVTGALVGGCVAPARRLRFLLQLPPVGASPPPPPSAAAASTAVLVGVTTHAGDAVTAADASTALQQLSNGNASSATAASTALVAAIQRLGEPRVTGVSLSAAAGGVTITAAPAPPAAPPPAAPALLPAALKTGAQLLPLRIVLAGVVGVCFCCVAPCILIGVAAWNAAACVIMLLGVRGTWDASALIEVGLSAEDEKAVGGSAEQTPLDAAGSALQSGVRRFFGARLASSSVRALEVRSLQPAEAALHAALLWPGSDAAKDDVTKDASPLAEGDEVEAAFTVTAVFRSPVAAWRWRAAVDAGGAGGKGRLARDLSAALAGDAPSVADLCAALALLRPVPTKRESGAGAAAHVPPAKLARRATLFVTSHPLRK